MKKKFILKSLSCLLALTLVFCTSTSASASIASKKKTEYPFVFVHGLMGWGVYDFYYDIMPYWGMMGGDFMSELQNKGYECYYPSVDGSGSAWDRACELYAELAGEVVDYGEAHSREHNHNRYGKDYTEKPLMKNRWDENNKINFVGHSFGGVTVRLLAELMQNGSEAERNATTDGTLSELFNGGKGSYIYSITTLSAPHNGTSAYESASWAGTTENKCLTVIEKLYSIVDPSKLLFDVVVGLHSDRYGNVKSDNAHYDMHIDNALELNKSISTLDNVYYFSYATCATTENESGHQVPTFGEMEPLFYTRSIAIGKNAFTTAGGYDVDEKWWANDGLVNTYSALAPFNAPQKEYDSANVEKGVWNIMPVVYGNHTHFMGDLILSKDIVPFFEELITMINSL